MIRNSRFPRKHNGSLYAWRCDFAQFMDKEIENFRNYYLVQLGLYCVQVVHVGSNCWY